jgi:hypothetical protein
MVPLLPSPSTALALAVSKRTVPGRGGDGAGAGAGVGGVGGGVGPLGWGVGVGGGVEDMLLREIMFVAQHPYYQHIVVQQLLQHLRAHPAVRVVAWALELISWAELAGKIANEREAERRNSTHGKKQKVHTADELLLLLDKKDGCDAIVEIVNKLLGNLAGEARKSEEGEVASSAIAQQEIEVRAHLLGLLRLKHIDGVSFSPKEIYPQHIAAIKLLSVDVECCVNSMKACPAVPRSAILTAGCGGARCS